MITRSSYTFTRLAGIFIFSTLTLFSYAGAYAQEPQQAAVQWAISATENELLGLKALRGNDPVTALKYFEKTYEIDPSMGSAAFYAALSSAKSGHVDAAFSWLEKALQAKYTGVNKIKNSKDLDVLHGDKRWNPLLLQFEAIVKADADFWDGSTRKTPYKTVLTEDERIAGLSRVWSEVKYNFVFVDKLVSLDWDGVYFRYLPKIRAATSNDEYYKLLTEMVALLGDGHTNVYPSQEDYEKYYTKPLIYTELMEGRVILRWVGDPAMLKEGIARGDEVISVNGIPVREYMEKSLGHLISAGTTQDKNVRLYQYQFLSGPIDEKLVLACRDKNGVEKSVKIGRVTNKERNEILTWSQYDFQMIEGNIALVKLNSFADMEIAKFFLSDFEKITKAKALILDVRENGGGNANVGFEILRTLTPEAFPTSRASVRHYRSASRIQYGLNTEFTYPTYRISPSKQYQFAGPVIVLTAAQTFSAAEDFVVAFKNMKRGLVVGGYTAGSTGQPLSFDLPGGGSARVCSKKDTFPDGVEFVGKGVAPDIEVYRMVKDFRTKRDTVLQAAIAELTRPAGK